MKVVTIALIGAGFAANFHANAYSKVSGVDIKIKYIFDIDIAKSKSLAQKWGIEKVALGYQEILDDTEVDLVDIVLPPVLHLEFAFQALKAGKHVVCEKPLTGYFGEDGDKEPIGLNVPKSKMYTSLLKQIDEAREIVKKSGKLFMYAENYVYSPNVLRAAEMVRAKKSKILYMKGEESIRCSTSPLSAYWSKVGGGSLIRLGSHPIGGMLWLKQQEAEARGGKITVVSVTAEIGRLAPTLSENDRRYFKGKNVDVEDFSNVTITFSDGTKAICIANDNTLGGVKNYVEIYTSDSVIMCNITPSDNLQTYFLDQDGLDDVYISEQLKEKTGWNNVFIAEETLRGYLPEFQNFVESVAYGREPMSGIDLAYDTIKVIYAAYLSAEEGRKVEL